MKRALLHSLSNTWSPPALGFCTKGASSGILFYPQYFQWTPSRGLWKIACEWVWISLCLGPLGIADWYSSLQLTFNEWIKILPDLLLPTCMVAASSSHGLRLCSVCLGRSLSRLAHFLACILYLKMETKVWRHTCLGFYFHVQFFVLNLIVLTNVMFSYSVMIYLQYLPHSSFSDQFCGGILDY